MAPGQISLPTLSYSSTTDMKANGVNGAPSSPAMSSPSTTYRRQTGSYNFRSSSMGGSFTSDASATNMLHSTAQMLEKRGVGELGFGVFESISRTSFINLVEFIGTERLTSLPHKGSKWDKVLIRALYFAEQQHGFEKMIRGFGAEDSTAAHLGYGYAKLLLELGHENAVALDKAFAVLYKHSLEVAALLHRAELLSTTPQIREQLCLMYGDLLTLTSAVATRYYKAVRGMASSKVSLDVYEVCGDVIQSFRDRQAQVADLIWHHQAQIAGFDIDHGVSAKTLKRWLIPNDRVMTALSQDHTIHLGGQAEFTCLWFQKPLATFSQSTGRVMAVTGQPGSGKSVLAASIVERLQRPLGRQTFSTLFYSISSNMPSAATPVSVLKSLLAQLFKMRVGNMHMYQAITRAYEQCRTCSDLKNYENHLWEALEEAFKKPLDNARDLFVVVDGLDEMQGGKAAAQAFFEKLSDIICEGQRVKLIGLAQSLSLPSGIDTTHIEMTAANVHDDLYSVILKTLMHAKHLNSRPGPEQEQILDRLVRASHGSFIWATLVSQILLDQKSAEEFNKTVDSLEKSPPSVQDLIQRTVTRHELSSTAKTILSWIVSVQRPLTTSEIKTLLSSNTQDPAHTEKDQEVDVSHILQPLAPLLSFSEGVIRFTHQTIVDSVTTLVDSGKIGIPFEKRHTDILLRILSYARTTLREESDPTFTEFDPDSLDRSFREFPLLSYVVRYWVVHIQRLGESKKPQDLSKVLPNNSTLSRYERTLWTLDLPLPLSLEYYKTATHTRQTTLTELSPAVLQSIINTAITYEVLQRPADAAPLYFTCTKTSRNLLSNYHPLPVECGYRFLSVTDSMVTTTRSETMTRREEVFKILITVFERQYGKHSSQVIQVRTTLAQFYEHIHEHQKAAEIYQSIKESTTQIYGSESTEARDASNTLRVVLGRSKSDQKIETRSDSIFDEEEEMHVEETLDLAGASRGLTAAKSERDFVELWQRISHICRSTTASEWHEKNIEVTQAYSKYLVSHKRNEEASAILSSVAREYETNQASFSDRVVAKLSETATLMREMGQITAALAILRRTSQFYQSMHKHESHQHMEVQRQITTVMSELVQTSTTESHGYLLEDIFRVTIKNESKAVDAKIMEIAKRLVNQHMALSNPSSAIEIIKLVLRRTWPSFLSGGQGDVEMPTLFPKETVELVELMAQCYTRLRQPDDVERTLVRLFNALLTAKTIDFTMVNKIQTLLIHHYDENNYPEKTIAILQKSLPARRTQLGPAHEDTTKTLYDLGSRCRQKARSYPFWIDYYQQIVTNLNKDSDICNPKAMDAIVIVATEYWEDRRYPEALAVFSVLWKTFIQKPKDYPQFSKTEFVERLYERYYQVLEQTGARFEILYQITQQFQTTSRTIFGAQSTTVTKATLALARICYTSETHKSQALGYYEEASKMPGTTTSDRHSEIQSALSALYTLQIMTQSSKSVSSETLDRACSRTSEQYTSSVSKYGYAHESSLTHLHEMSLLYHRQSKSEVACKELTKASTEIISKETSSVRMIEAAESIVRSFEACHSMDYCRKLVMELHRQIVAKDTSSASAWGFNVSKYGRTVLHFLAAMEYRISTDSHLSFSQLMAELTTEAMYYEEYRSLVKSNANLQVILIAASTLRKFLVKMKRQDVANALDTEVGKLFVARDGARIKFRSQNSARIFMVAIMEYLTQHKTANFMKAVILASNERLEQLMASEQWVEAYDIAGCAFTFAIDFDGYSGPRGISHGFNLASTVAGVGVPKKCPDAALRKEMLHLSNDIVKKVLEVCKKQDINFAQIQIRELDRLVMLLGEQEDYQTLEWLLTTLWNTREAQRSWSEKTLHNLGRRLICARYLAGHPIKAIRLCEDIAYNLRRTRGPSHPATADMNALLAQLYTGSGQYYLQHGSKDKTTTELANQSFTKAMAVHEEMLRMLVNDKVDDAGIPDDEDLDTTSAILAEHGITLGGRDGEVAVPAAQNGHIDQGSMAKTHLRLLKLAYQRLGSWPKSHTEYERLVGSTVRAFPNETKDVQGADKWQAKGFGGGKAESEEGSFEKITNWHIIEA